MITPRTPRAEEERLAAMCFSYPRFVTLSAMNMMKISWKNNKGEFIATLQNTKAMAFPSPDCNKSRGGGLGGSSRAGQEEPFQPVSHLWAGVRRRARLSRAAGAAVAHGARRRRRERAVTGAVLACPV